jgi:nicotinic acid mononucleotide adenylyltransferase
MCSEKQRRRQVCLFGTSANPPTGDGGHVGIVQSLSELQRFDEIRILPVYRHTFAGKRDLVSYEHRMNMCKIAFADIPKAKTCDAEQRSFERMARNM